MDLVTLALAKAYTDKFCVDGLQGPKGEQGPPGKDGSLTGNYDGGRPASVYANLRMDGGGV